MKKNFSKEDFIKTYGDNPQEVTRNYSTKSLGTNYSTEDAFNEFADNSDDAKIDDCPVRLDINYDDETKTLSFLDNGTGVYDPKVLFRLGGTDKESVKNKTGKYGIGVPGAVSAIATKCVFNKEEPVDVTYVSANNGYLYEMHVGIFPDGETYYGDIKQETCDTSYHYTKVTFSNIEIKNYNDIIKSLEETHERQFEDGFSIYFNNRQLGVGMKKTFVGDERIKTVQVGKFPVDIRYRIIGGEDSDASDRLFDEAGLRIYDKETHRLLAKGKDYWKWFGGRQAQQNICGVRCAIEIPSDIDCYNKFGIKPAKNGINYKKYFTRPEFAELSQEIWSIYQQASKTRGKTDKQFRFGDKVFITAPSGMKMDLPYMETSKNNFMIKNKYSTEEVAEILNELVTLKEKVIK